MALISFFYYKISSGQTGSSKMKPAQAEVLVLAKFVAVEDRIFAKVFIQFPPFFLFCLNLY